MGEDIVSKYSSSLAELKMNSKPLINLLTMMAEDYIRHAPSIVQVIERHLTTVRPEIKLPVLYLIDSIIKNVKKDYVELFTQNIVSTFCGVFEKVDEKTRGLLWKLRGTWSDYFPTKKLYAIDVRCHQLDPKWPIMAQAPSSASIHVNPRFLNRGKATTALINPEHIIAQTTASAAVASTPDDSVMEVQMRAQLLAKQKELLELQTRKVELELLQTKLQMEEKARRQKEEETAKQIDMAVKQEQVLVGMAEMAKNKTERIQQKLSSMHMPSSSAASASSSIKGSPSSSKGHESSSDRESHSSFPSKLTKSSNETSASSVDNSPSKKSKSSRDRDRRDRGKNDKSKESRHDSKDKESRHRHRDKDRHADNKDKEKGRHERSRDPAATLKAGGEWKDYNEAKKVSSKRVYRKSSGVDSDEENEDSKKDLLRKQTPTPPPMSLSPSKSGSGFRISSDSREDNEVPSQSASPTKSPQPFSHSGDSSPMSSGIISPLKRRLPKEKQPEKDRKGRDKSDKSKEKPVVSDPRLRKRHDKQKSPKSSEEADREEARESPTKTGSEWKDYRERQKAVLRRTYRKNTGIDGKEEHSSDSNHLLNSDIGPGDVDLRFEAPMDLDLRTEADANGTEPPAKKSRSGKDSQHSTFDDLFGHQDVDLRPNSSCWTQVKIKSENAGEHATEDGGKGEDELPRPRRDSLVLRSPGPPSPATSISSSRSTCDPLGRPLIYNRLPNDPEERKRSLDSRSTSIDPVEQFRAQHIDRALRSTGVLSDTDMKSICIKAKEELDLGLLSPDQYCALMKQICQISEASAMREVQQMQQIKGATWQSSAANAIPNPWMTETDENNIWSVCPAPPRPGIVDFPSTARFPGPNTWEPSGDLPWMAANMPAAPRGPNPFEEAIGAPAPTMVDDLVPKAVDKDIRVAERDVGRPIPIDGIMRQVRYYRETAIVMMGKMSDDPRELTFQKDNTSRVVLINGKRLEVYLGETKKFDINRMPHTLKIGSPGRELYIDDRPHEMYFGGPPKKIFLEGRPHSFQLISQAPQVSVGQVPRFDLVAGRVNLTIDAVSNVPVYLDEKLQKIDVFGVPVLLRFCSNFQTVTLNGRPFPTNFGARLPFTITLHGSGKHYFRFSAITPNLENAIHAFISANYGGDWNERNNHFAGRGRGGLFRGAAGARGRGRPPRDMLVDNRSTGPNPWAPEGMSENQESSSNVNPLDLLNNLFNTSDTKNNTEQTHTSEQRPSENDQGGESESTGEESSGVNLNVSDLVANLIKFGLLPAASSNTPESSSVEPVPENDAEGDEKMNEESSGETPSSTQSKESQDKEKEKEKPEEPSAPVIPPLPTVDVTFDENLKEKRNIAIAQIFTGVQCSQCGLRFPPDQTLRYSQHLDWHFRQNRREKANARKALSRKWYYDMSDWIQFEEIEDLEERAASLFENQETENDNDMNSPSALLNHEDYTVLASSHEGTGCPQCGETFESYFDEEREEWRLKNAKLDDCDGEKKLYHPNCYEDYLKSLVEESIVEDPEEEQQEQEDEVEPLQTEDNENVPKLDEDDDEVLIIKEGKKEVVVMEIDIDDDVEKNDTVNEIVNEENHSIDMERKTDDVLIEKDDDIQTDGATSGIDNALDNTRNLLVQSPILIDEDSTFLPGLSDNAEGCVFGFAQNTEAQREIRMEEDLETKIIYTPMKFDIPPIKIEPPDEEPVPEETTTPDEWLSNLQPYLSSSVRSPGGSEPMNVDLTEEDSTDAVDSGARLVNQTRTSIDGNLQHEESATLPFIPAPKIRINIFGMDTTPCNSPKDKDKVDSPVLSRADEGTPSQEEALVKDNGNENNIISNNMEMNKDNPVDPVLTEEVKRLKPRLVGTKLTNCPPKFTGTEESGLCVIC